MSQRRISSSHGEGPRRSDLIAVMEGAEARKGCCMTPASHFHFLFVRSGYALLIALYRCMLSLT